MPGRGRRALAWGRDREALAWCRDRETLAWGPAGAERVGRAKPGDRACAADARWSGTGGQVWSSCRAPTERSRTGVCLPNA